MSSFVNRVRDVAEARDALARARLVTLTGVGGVGKTRLALQVAADVAPGYPDGAWLCELAPADADTMAQLLASTLGVAPRPGLSVEDSIIEYARPKQMLVLLDNCEHVLSAAARTADALLRACPGVRVLATSRQPLGIEGEQMWPVGPLAVPGSATRAGAPPATEVKSDAVQLFVDRARAVWPDFTLAGANGEAVVEIVRRLDGIPLAIELAAARVVVLSASDILARLDERFRLLTVATGGKPERHRTLRATVDWSYALLDATEQAFFDRLGVLSGTFDASSAAAIGETDALGALELLAGLVTKSMVVKEDGPGGTARYRLLETLRQYALDHLVAAGEEDALRRRHARHYAGVGEMLGPALLGRDELRWRPRLRADLDNLRSAVHWALGSGSDEDGELAVRIGSALAAYAVHEAAGDIASWLEASIARARCSTPAWRCAVLGAAAFAAFQNHGDIALANSLALEVLRHGVPADCPAPAQAYAALAMSQAFTGQVGEALATLSEATEVLERIGASAYFRAYVLQTVAAVSAMAGDLEPARAAARQSLALARSIGNPSELCNALWTVTFTNLHDDPVAASAAAEENISLTRAGASGATFGHVLPIRAELRARAGEALGALRDLEEALMHSYDKGDRVMLTVAFDRGVTVLALLGHPELAAIVAGIAGSTTLAPLSILPPAERADREATLEQLRAALGDATYDAAVTRGSAMSLDVAVDHTVTELQRIELDVEDEASTARAVPPAPR